MSNRLDGIEIEERLERLNEISWDFEGARSRSLLSSTHFHPARYISQLPSVLITLLSSPGDVVLDPFCGSGTTLVEAQRLSRPSIGFDINPISVLVSRAKTLASNAEQVRGILNGFAGALLRQDPRQIKYVPSSVQLEKWYNPPVSLALASLYENIILTQDKTERLIKEFCFSSILMKVCRETRHWGYVCDNTEPKDAPERNVPEILDRAISEIVTGFTLRAIDDTPATIYEDRAANAARILEFNSVDLVVTSPPYFGVVDYVKSQRLSMEWFGLDVETYRKIETGARSKRHRRRAEAEFDSELEQSFNAVFKCMKPRSVCCLIFGISPSRQYSFEKLFSMLGRIGFEIRRNHTRQISVQRTQKPSVLTERLILLTKPGS